MPERYSFIDNDLKLIDNFLLLIDKTYGIVNLIIIIIIRGVFMKRKSNLFLKIALFIIGNLVLICLEYKNDEASS